MTKLRIPYGLLSEKAPVVKIQRAERPYPAIRMICNMQPTEAADFMQAVVEIVRPKIGRPVGVIGKRAHI